jgi:malonate-semialdehyde dehydrogenase (acetylating) / methylmalonate-semialdehyde dehydrogenase
LYFGNGIKGSFYGDLHATGKDGVRFFTENKVEITSWFSEPVPSPAVHRPMETRG